MHIPNKDLKNFLDSKQNELIKSQTAISCKTLKRSLDISIAPYPSTIYPGSKTPKIEPKSVSTANMADLSHNKTLTNKKFPFKTLSVFSPFISSLFEVVCLLNKRQSPDQYKSLVDSFSLCLKSFLEKDLFLTTAQKGQMLEGIHHLCYFLVNGKESFVYETLKNLQISFYKKFCKKHDSLFPISNEEQANVYVNQLFSNPDKELSSSFKFEEVISRTPWPFIFFFLRCGKLTSLAEFFRTNKTLIPPNVYLIIHSIWLFVERDINSLENIYEINIRKAFQEVCDEFPNVLKGDDPFKIMIYFLLCVGEDFSVKLPLNVAQTLLQNSDDCSWIQLILSFISQRKNLILCQNSQNAHIYNNFNLDQTRDFLLSLFHADPDLNRQSEALSTPLKLSEETLQKLDFSALTLDFDLFYCILLDINPDFAVLAVCFRLLQTSDAKKPSSKPLGVKADVHIAQAAIVLGKKATQSVLSNQSRGNMVFFVKFAFLCFSLCGEQFEEMDANSVETLAQLVLALRVVGVFEDFVMAEKWLRSAEGVLRQKGTNLSDKMVSKIPPLRMFFGEEKIAEVLKRAGEMALAEGNFETSIFLFSYAGDENALQSIILERLMKTFFEPTERIEELSKIKNWLNADKNLASPNYKIKNLKFINPKFYEKFLTAFLPILECVSNFSDYFNLIDAVQNLAIDRDEKQKITFESNRKIEFLAGNLGTLKSLNSDQDAINQIESMFLTTASRSLELESDRFSATSDPIPPNSTPNSKQFLQKLATKLMSLAFSQTTVLSPSQKAAIDSSCQKVLL